MDKKVYLKNDAVSTLTMLFMLKILPVIIEFKKQTEEKTGQNGQN